MLKACLSGPEKSMRSNYSAVFENIYTDEAKA
jgi:hypothetical protein